MYNACAVYPVLHAEHAYKCIPTEAWESIECVCKAKSEVG